MCNVYIFAADIYCEDCGLAIRKRLTDSGDEPADPSDEKSYDSDKFPKGPYPDGGGEADSPNHCGDCRKGLGNDLTRAGVKYVVDALNEARERSDLLDEWAKGLTNYAHGKGDTVGIAIGRYESLPRMK